jgi:flavin-dependent dehydrogenase
MSDIEVPVLIAGGSLVGMSAALLLGHHGIPALVVEHHRGTAIHPRAAMITQRTMEILRTVGIEQIVLRKSDEQFVQDGAIMAVETLAGKELAWFIANLNEGVRDVSPSWFRLKKTRTASPRKSASATAARRAASTHAT